VNEDLDSPTRKDPVEENYVIEIGDNVSPAGMKSLKEFLEQNKGETPVTLLMKGKKIKLPFGVNLSENFKSELERILE